MESNIRYSRSDLFPTPIIKVDLSKDFTLQDQQEMIDDIDHLIDTGMYENTGHHPLYQTKIVLFNEDRPKIWTKLKYSFHNACHFYLQQVPQFCTHNLDSLIPTDSNAWAFKSWASLNKTQNNNPIHAHSPAFLSGIFYLKIPTNVKEGTEFFDPRDWAHSTPASYVTDPTLFSWIIFPGWLPHRSCLVDSEEPRYVIAANIYVAPSTYRRQLK